MCWTALLAHVLGDDHRRDDNPPSALSPPRFLDERASSVTSGSRSPRSTAKVRAASSTATEGGRLASVLLMTSTSSSR